MSETIAKNNHFATQRELQQLRVEIQNLNQLKQYQRQAMNKIFEISLGSDGNFAFVRSA